MLSVIRSVLIIVSGMIVFLLVRPEAVLASPVEGAKLFQSNCAACHALGTNRIMAMKNLQKEALEKYDMYSKEAITYQVIHGKNAMPPFGGRLKPEQIEAIADYVLEQADLGWPL